MSRLDRHQVNLHLLTAAVVERATELGDPHLVALVTRLAAVSEEHRHLLDAVLEALDDGA